MNQKFFIIYFIFLLFITSCGSRKNFNYLQGHIDEKIEVKNIKLKQGDLIGVKIFGCDQQSLELFNIPGIQNQTQPQGIYSPAIVANGYFINSMGMIDLPLIGEVKLEGLCISEASEAIKLKLKKYITDPKVNVQILNFRITILGDVSRPGTIFISDDKVSLLEALGLVGDLNSTAKRSDILIMRNENGVLKDYRINLTNKDFLNSPTFFLQQNDFIFVEANQAKINSSKVSSSWSIAITIASLVITTFNFIVR